MARQSFPVLTFMFFAVTLSSGCTTFPQYRLRFEQPHKDVARVVVHVPTRLDAGDYRRIVRTELGRVFEACSDQAVPVYEVRFDFVVPTEDSRREEKVASYSCTVGEVAAKPVSVDGRALILY